MANSVEWGRNLFSIDTGNNVSFSRPADTTQYAAGDAVSDSTSSPTVLSFENITDKAQGAILIQEVLVTSSANESTLPKFNLWLFDAEPTAINDNAAFTLTDAENNTVQAVIALDSDNADTRAYTATNNSRMEGTNRQRIIRLGTNTTLYGLLEVTNAYTPVSGETFTITLKGLIL